jgi:uncharacterized membrane protein YkgB
MNDQTLAINQDKLEISLFLLRLGIFIVMMAWTLDKFIDPEHGIRVFERFYFLGGMSTAIMMGIGAIEILVILAFMLGLWKKYTYGIVMIAHSVSTFSSWKQYTIDMNLLFFAAWPMLAACVALFLLREHDKKFTI